MKRILTIVVVLVIALTYGYVFASEMAMKAEPVKNGVTVFDAITIYDSGPLALSRTSSEGAGLAPENGLTVFGAITWFDVGPLAVASEQSVHGVAAGGLGGEESAMQNGATIFTIGPNPAY
jgi:hypothetical protein